MRLAPVAIWGIRRDPAVVTRVARRQSMTTHADHRIWQDVYHAETSSGDQIYLKLTVIDDVLIVSFKELEA